MKQETAIVPLNITKLESVPVNRARKVTVDDKKSAREFLGRAINQRRDLLDDAANKIRTEILSAARKDSGWDGFIKQVRDLEAKIDTMVKTKNSLITRAQNATGFDLDGDLLSMPGYGYKADIDTVKEGRKKAKAIHEMANRQTDLITSMNSKFDKVEARIIVCDTYGELVDIMESVLGNGDTILEPPDIVTYTTTD